MKIWIGAVLVAALAFILFSFNFNNFQIAETPEEKQNKIDALRWKNLCAQIDCGKFPENYVTFVMTNGITLFLKKERCCEINGKSFYDPKLNRRVILDAEQVYFSSDDFEEIGIFKYRWSSQAKLYFSSSEKILYRGSRDNILRINLNIPDDINLSPDRSFEKLKNKKFSVIHQTMNNTGFFSIITSRSILFDHRISISCHSSCKIISYDFEEGPKKTGIHVYNLIGQTIPMIPNNCRNNIKLQDCSEFSSNEEVYFDFLQNIEKLYRFLQIHPNKRSSGN